MGSCENSNNRSAIVVSDNFLEGEWIIDSIVGQDTWIQDRLVFNGNNEFWWISHSNESYFVDSCLHYSNDTIYNGQNISYSTSALDSNSILIKSKKNIYHARRWHVISPRDINKYKRSDPFRKQIIGEWTLIESEMLPIKIPSWCKNLNIGTKFNFGTNGKMLINSSDTTLNEYCDSYSFTVWKNQKIILNLTENDMKMSYDIESIDSNYLELYGKFGQTPIPIKIKLKKSRC